MHQQTYVLRGTIAEFPGGGEGLRGADRLR